MRWHKDAEEAVSRVPFFVRGRVKRRVEQEATRSGVQEVRPEHVRTAQRRYLERTEEEVRGYQVETCFGPSGCPNRAVVCDEMASRLEERLSRRDLKGFLKGCVQGPLKLHHEFRISVSDCPNACSRPQIADVGLIGACRPRVSEQACSQCSACVEACREGAISLRDTGPVLDEKRCLSCGQCIPACPTGTIGEGTRGYRILLGGKLGRHPRLGQELPGICGPEEALAALDQCLDHYQRNCQAGERLGEILERTGEGWLEEEGKGQEKRVKKRGALDLGQGTGSGKRID